MFQTYRKTKPRETAICVSVWTATFHERGFAVRLGDSRLRAISITEVLDGISVPILIRIIPGVITRHTANGNGPRPWLEFDSPIVHFCYSV